MQTILGAGGQIADELARELYRNYTHDIRLISRHPRKVHDTDQLVSADLMDAEATDTAVEGSEIAYLTVGLPANSGMWEEKFPTMMANAIAACERHGVRLVFFDNTYMYPRTAEIQAEGMRFEPVGRKARVRAQLATMLLDEMAAGQIVAVICRAPEFYGPGKTQSVTNAMVLGRIAQGKRPFVPISAHAKRTLIWTPDASRALALIGNTADAYGQTWHLPVDHERLNYRQLIKIASAATGRGIGYTTVPGWAFRIGGWINPTVKEIEELLPRYRQDNIFDSTKFQTRFPGFPITTYREGIAQLLGGSNDRA
ncbi:NAD-dependent epimerase/dehydratase family protein [Bifidobacterium sp.]|jgi:nucleoside-diphosphate-sugar epimerase|uniref:NAD-dependent epimerase/dehydratase family protein n=1 Tax=Bifidobacterium sp. TaxID=41200 RepID=UPI0025BCD506|nr:NAD-dependent epimerase/dehydratase family protein [Bifidobacterium sp.]MCH4208552.1 NAD-dependent epimerase/dehydratase family protein [Bifidobacterium sp.]MCI1224238.1 NAD-dependent epimerase/dehydratase family protein [Bifidobacterium sp.]